MGLRHDIGEKRAFKKAGHFLQYCVPFHLNISLGPCHILLPIPFSTYANTDMNFSTATSYNSFRNWFLGRKMLIFSLKTSEGTRDE